MFNMGPLGTLWRQLCSKCGPTETQYLETLRNVACHRFVCSGNTVEKGLSGFRIRRAMPPMLKPCGPLDSGPWCAKTLFVPTFFTSLTIFSWHLFLLAPWQLFSDAAAQRVSRAAGFQRNRKPSDTTEVLCRPDFHFLYKFSHKQCGHTAGFLQKQLRPGVQSRWYPGRPALKRLL